MKINLECCMKINSGVDDIKLSAQVQNKQTNPLGCGSSVVCVVCRVFIQLYYIKLLAN